MNAAVVSNAADALSGAQPAGSGHLQEASIREIKGGTAESNEDIIEIDYRFDLDGDLPGHVYYDMTPLLAKSLPMWGTDHCLDVTVKLPEGVELLVQIQNESGRWFQAFKQAAPNQVERLSFVLDRRTFGQSWMPGSKESYRGAIYPPIQALRIGLRGQGEGTAYFEGLAIRPVYSPLTASSGVAKVERHSIEAEEASLTIEGAPGDAPVVRVADYGGIPDDNVDDTRAVWAALEACRAYPEAILMFEKGRYDMLKSREGVEDDFNLDRIALLLTDFSNLTLRGNQSEFILHRVASAIVLRRCQNVVLEGLTIDWAKPPYAHGVVIKEHKGALDIKLDDGYSPEDSGSVNMIMRYDAGSRQLDDKEPLTLHCGRKAVGKGTYVDEFVYAPWETTAIGNGIIRMQCDDEAGAVLQRSVREGDLLLLRYGDYRNNGITIIDSDRILIRDFNIYASSGMGFWTTNSSNLHLDGLAIEPRAGTDRLMSITADGVHFKDCFGVILMENCVVRRMADDCVNLKTRFHRIREKAGDQITMRLWRPNSHMPLEGEHFGLYDTGGLVLGDLTLSDIRSTKDPLVWRATIDAKNARNWPEDAALLASLDRMPSAVIIRNCTFGESRGRGILLQVPNALIEGNRFRSISDRAIWVTYDTVQFGEARPSSQILIRDNRIVDCPRLWRNSAIQVSGYLVEAPPGSYVFQDIQILDNEISELPFDRARGIKITNTRDLIIEGNVIRKDPEPAFLPGFSSETAPIMVTNSANVVIQDNELESPIRGPVIVDQATLTSTYFENNKGMVESVLVTGQN